MSKKKKERHQNVMEKSVTTQYFEAWHLNGSEGYISYMSCVYHKYWIIVAMIS